MYLPMSKMTINVSTLHYRAPELIMGDKYYGFGVDIWSIAIVMYMLKHKRLLFDGGSEIEQLFKIFDLLGTPHLS